MSDSKEILAVGSIAYDSIQTPRGNKDRILGGSATYFGLSASYYSKVSLVGVVGNDFTNKDWSLFDKFNINTDLVETQDGDTFTWGGVYNSDYSHRKTLFTELGVFENFRPKINKNYNNPILYLGNIQPQLQLNVINKINNPYLIAADTMNLWIDMFQDKVWNLISKVNIMMLNDEEAIQLTGKRDLEEIADQLLFKGPKIVIIKKGAAGSLLAYKNKKINISVVPNTQVIDPTGAGDSFAGGLLGYIAKNGIKYPINAVIHASAIASYTVSGFGVEKLCCINNQDLNEKINQINFE